MNQRSNDRDQDPVFHERPHLLSQKAYRGFSIHKTDRHWKGLKVTVANSKGMKLSASGETEEEALKKLIDQIDLFWDS